MPALSLSSLGSAALHLASLGFRVFPLRERGKVPFAGSNGSKDATTDADQIRAWWTMQPDANIGIATGEGVCVLDLDTPEAMALVKSRGLPETVSAKTAHGNHLYFKGTLRSLVGVLPGVDTRGEGGYVVAPPSVHESGAVYTWEDSPEHVALADVPPWLVAQCTRSPAVSAPAMADAVIEGGRNSALASLAGTIRRRGIEEGLLFEMLRSANDRLCRPPLDEKEVQKIARSVAAYPSAEPLPTTGPSVVAGGLTWPQIAAPLPPVPWLCRELHIAPGRPVLLSAPPGAGKTWIAVDLALSVATGSARALDSVDVQRGGKVVHLNFDYPAASARRRYTRMAYGRQMGTSEPLIELWNREQLAGMSLCHAGARDWLKRVAEGCAMVVIDALRGALPGIDMNDSRVRDYLDLLLEASDATGATFVVIHHDKKAGKDGDGGALKQERAGGSHQIAAGCDVTLHVEKAGGGAWKISAGKVSEGKASEDGLLVSLEDLDAEQAGEDGLSPGVRFTRTFVEEAAQKQRKTELVGFGQRVKASIAARDLHAETVLAMIRDNPGEIVNGDVRGELKKSNAYVVALFAGLVEDGRAVNRGTSRRPRWFAVATEKVASEASE